MKVHIAFPWRSVPWGGGNQFLQALRGELKRRGSYAADPAAASAILFNSHHDLPQAYRLRHRYPKALFIHRLDGPLALVRGDSWTLDRRIWRSSRDLADAVVWQSEWSRDRNLAAGATRHPFMAVIPNAPDPQFFFPGKSEREPRRLIAVSWSDNLSKGFATYAWLSARLARLGWTLTVIGNCPVPLPHAKVLPPQPSARLGQLLREHDVYLTASRADPCSNALLEALACGLPVVARREGGHPELVGGGGLLFSDRAELLVALQRMRRDYDLLRSRIVSPTISQVAVQYLAVVMRVAQAVERGDHTPGRLPTLTRWRSYVGLA